MAKVVKATKKVKESKTKSVLTPEERQEALVPKKYELMFILSPVLTEDKRKKILNELGELLASNNAEIFHVDDWGKRDLAYKIKKQEEGYYMIYYITLANTEALKDFDHYLRLEQGILRYLFMKREDDYEIRDFTIEEVVEEPAEKEKKEVEKEKPKKAAVAKKIEAVKSNTNDEV